MTPTRKKHILFLMSDTGGGHRASMNAIVGGLHDRYGENTFTWSYVDVFRHMRYPNNKAPELYPHLVGELRPLWALTYTLLDDVRRSQWYTRYLSVLNKYRLIEMLRDNPADLVVCVHSIVARPTMDALLEIGHRPPYITVVTDLFTTPYFWYDPRVDRCLVPTQRAFERGLEAGMDAGQMAITGLPVHPRFMQNLTDKADARQRLGWDPNLPAILIVGGSDGMGPLFETARAINDLKLKCQLAIVAGRNNRLAQKLRTAIWNQPVHIYPFIDYMPRLMAGADVLVTKAGPSSISEALIAGLPVILYDRIPGQEEGNVDFVVQNEIGIFTPQPEKAADAVREWLGEGEAGMRARSERARSFAEPDASFKIADEIWRFAAPS